MQIKEGLIIAPNYIKKEILKKLSKEKKLINIKIMNKKEFIQNYYGKSKKEALYFIMQKYNLNYEVAKNYLDNIFINSKTIKPYFDILKKENLIETNPYFKNNLKNIKVIGYSDIDPYILKDLNKYNLQIINQKSGTLEPIVHEFVSQTDEITYVAIDIIKKIKEEKVNINDIYISGITEEYKSELIRIFNLFKVPFSFNKKNSLYSAPIVQTFIKNIKKTKDINKSLEHIPSAELKNQIIDIINTLSFPQIDNISLEIIENSLKNITVSNAEIKNAIKIIDINEITDKTKHYYILGLNQTVIPHIYKDDDIILDKEKESLGLLTSLQKNEIEKENLKYIIKTFPNLTLSYKQKDTFNTYYPSSIIEKLNLKIEKENQITYNYSNDYNKLKLGMMLDNYCNYNEKSDLLNSLYSTYPNIPYNEYSNKYTKISPQNLKEYINNNLTLSYTSLNNYALCPFKFYIKHILKLEPYEDTFPLLIGNLFHHVLSKIYDEKFNLEKEYYGYLKDKSLTPKEEFYIEKLYETLKEDINIIKWQESKSQYNKHLTEKQIEIDKSKDIKITFKGIIDKINYHEENQINVIIIDYKTGNVSATLDNINYGLNMQLPTYIYLVQKGLGKNYQVNGFYLQQVLTENQLDSKDSKKDTKDSLKLKGYTVNDESIIEKIDETYQNSLIINALKTTQKGFYAYSKIIDKEEIKKLEEITEDNINKTIDNILNTNFNVTPKRIDNKNISCEFCPFKDICYYKEEDIKDLKNTKFKDIIGGEENA